MEMCICYKGLCGWNEKIKYWENPQRTITPNATHTGDTLLEEPLGYDFK